MVSEDPKPDKKKSLIQLGNGPVPVENTWVRPTVDDKMIREPITTFNTSAKKAAAKTKPSKVAEATQDSTAL